MASEIRILPVEGVPEIRAGDDLPTLIADAARASGGVADGDVLVVTQKIVSKAEGRIVDLDDVMPGAFARQLAERWEKDARQIEVVLGETVRIVGSPVVGMTGSRGAPQEQRTAKALFETRPDVDPRSTN